MNDSAKAVEGALRESEDLKNRKFYLEIRSLDVFQEFVQILRGGNKIIERETQELNQGSDRLNQAISENLRGDK